MSASAVGVVIDTSAAVAVLLAEPTAETILEHLDAADLRLMSAPTFVELSIVLEARLGSRAQGIAARFVADGGVDVVAFDAVQAEAALSGWRRFGKGRHPAALNLGDCFTYAVAVTHTLPVLCTGNDFTGTDLAVLP